MEKLDNLINSLTVAREEYDVKPSKAKATAIRKILLNIGKETHEARKDILEASKQGYR